MHLEDPIGDASERRVEWPGGLASRSLDPRIVTKGYGRRFIASLPPAPVVYDLGAVEGFFSIV